MLVPVRGVVRRRHNGPAYARVVRASQDVVGHLDVLLLDEEVVDGSPFPQLVGEVNDGIDSLEVLLILRAVGVNEVYHANAINLLALTIPVTDIEEDEVVSRLEVVEHSAGNVSGGAGYKDFAFRHLRYILL